MHKCTYFIVSTFIKVLFCCDTRRICTTFLPLQKNTHILYLVYLLKFYFAVTHVGYVQNLKPVHKWTYFIFSTIIKVLSCCYTLWICTNFETCAQMHIFYILYILFKYCFAVTLVGYVHNFKPVHKC